MNWPSWFSEEDDDELDWAMLFGDKDLFIGGGVGLTLDVVMGL